MMAGSRVKKSGASYYLALIAVLIVFSIARIYRNSININSLQQGGIWNVLAAALVLIGLFSFVRLPRKPQAFVPMMVYAVWVWCADLLHAGDLSVYTLYYAITAPYFAFVAFAFYVACPAPSKSVVWVNRMAFFSIAAILFYVLFHLRSGTLEDLLLADVYYALCFLPLLLMYEPKLLVQLAAILATALLLVLSEKRAGLIGFLAFLFCQYMMGQKNEHVRQKLRRPVVLALVLGLCFLGYAYIRADIGSRLLFRMGKLVETGGAGRSRIYLAIWQAFLESPLKEQFFGHGRGSILFVPGVFHASAHSDFFHVLYVYGILPFLLFCSIYFFLFLEWKEMKRWNYPRANLFLGGMLLSGLLSMFSTFCVAFGYVTCGAAFWGVALADWHKFKTEIRL
jgi:hypothetical protein